MLTDDVALIGLNAPFAAGGLADSQDRGLAVDGGAPRPSAQRATACERPTLFAMRYAASRSVVDEHAPR